MPATVALNYVDRATNHNNRVPFQFHRREGELRDLKDSAAILELHEHKGIPWEPAPIMASFFQKTQSERASQRIIRQNGSRHVGQALSPANCPPECYISS